AGTTDYLDIPMFNLSATRSVTVSLWVKRQYSNGPRHTLFELTTNFNSFATGFGLFPDNNTTCVGGKILVGLLGDVGNNYGCFTQPSSGVWHHLVVIYDKPSAGAEVFLYVDGALQTPVSTPAQSNNTNAFAAAPFYL